MAKDERRVAGLLREREGLIQRGLDDRVAQVDAEITAYGGQVPAEPPEPAAPTQPADQSPEAAEQPKPGRGRKPQATAG